MTGWLQPAEPELWTAVIQTVLFDLPDEARTALAKRSKERVLREFSKKKMASNLEEQYVRMLRAPRRIVSLVGMLPLLVVVLGVLAIPFAIVISYVIA